MWCLRAIASTKGEMKTFSFTLNDFDVETELVFEDEVETFIFSFFSEEIELFEIEFSELLFSESSKTAINSPTGTTSFALNLCSSIFPEAGAGTSLSTLSVATSSKISPSSNESPSATSQLIIVPSVMLSPILGILNSVLIINKYILQSTEGFYASFYFSFVPAHMV